MTCSTMPSRTIAHARISSPRKAYCKSAVFGGSAAAASASARVGAALPCNGAKPGECAASSSSACCRSTVRFTKLLPAKYPHEMKDFGRYFGIPRSRIPEKHDERFERFSEHNLHKKCT